MFVFGHLGVGRRLIARRYHTFTKVERQMFALGALLPDLIDKPLYYGLSLATGQHGAGLGLIAGTHTFGHTGLFLIAISVAARLRGTRTAAALAIGVGTHLVLDTIGLTMDTATLLWPLLGWHFTAFRHRNLGAHLWTVMRPVTFTGEVLGIFVIAWDWWRARKQDSRSSPPSP